MKNKFLGIICLLYAGIIIYVDKTGSLKNFLAPNMQIYIKAAIIPLLVIGLIILTNDKIKFRFHLTDLVLLIPLVILLLSGDGKLTTEFARNRVTIVNSSKKTTKNVESKKETEEIEENEDIDDKEDNIESDKYNFSKPDFDISDEDYYDLANYLTYSHKSVKYEGMTIRVRGFILDNGSNLPDGLYGLGKYGISCCAADASFVGFLIKDADNIKIDSWYEVEGVFEKIKDLKGKDILAIKVINIKELDKDDEELYVYPCYTLGDGKCENIKKYNLEY